MSKRRRRAAKVTIPIVLSYVGAASLGAVVTYAAIRYVQYRKAKELGPVGQLAQQLGFDPSILIKGN